MLPNSAFLAAAFVCLSIRVYFGITFVRIVCSFRICLLTICTTHYKRPLTRSSKSNCVCNFILKVLRRSGNDSSHTSWRSEAHQWRTFLSIFQISLHNICDACMCNLFCINIFSIYGSLKPYDICPVLAMHRKVSTYLWCGVKRQIFIDLG